MKASGPGQFFYSRKRIGACASFVILVVILALVIIPICILSAIVREDGTSGGGLNQKQIASTIGVFLVFTLLFSAMLSFLTSAKRHEIFGVTAA